METKQLLEEVKKRLVKTFNPVEIYLFGSYAWGTPNDESDLDLLIIVDQLTQKPCEAQSLGYHVLFDVDVPKDIVVFPKADFELRAKKPSSLFYKIKQRGVKIYARA